MSSLLRQVALLAAGCQPWHKDVCAANGDRFAYCATLAVYIYEVSAARLRGRFISLQTYIQVYGGPAATMFCKDKSTGD